VLGASMYRLPCPSTILLPIAGGAVRQHIEVSMDGGASWRTTFDAEYRPVR
jgi:hypothetical protein